MAPLLVTVMCLVASGCASTRKAASSEDTGSSEPTAKIRPATGAVAPTPEALEEANRRLNLRAKELRAQWQAKTFEEFESSVYKEPGEGGKYIVNGDTPIADRKHLREFFESNIKQEPPATRPGQLIVHLVGGQQAVWNSTLKKQLSYCVSTTFGARHGQVVTDMDGATGAWEKVADVDFVYIASQDSRCTASNANVVFDVRPVSSNGQYLARAFFPNEPRADRNVLIDDSSFQLDPNGKLTLVGILRHELGHSIGWRHEHTRPESGTCFEDNNWVPVTAYDKFSVMHYPQCNGGGDWSLALTDLDKNGAACVYGPAPGFQVNTSLCVGQPRPAPPSPCGPKTQVFHDQRVTKGQKKPHGPFTVAPGTRFEAKMTGKGTSPGDPDLYVQFGVAPDLAAGKYACRPYLTGADETCSLDVPAGKTKAHVMVHGYEAGSYDLAVTFAGQP